MLVEDHCPDVLVGITKKHRVEDYLDDADTQEEAIEVGN